MLYTGRNPQPEPPRKHNGKEKLPFNRKKPGRGPGPSEQRPLLFHTQLTARLQCFSKLFRKSWFLPTTIPITVATETRAGSDSELISARLKLD